MTWEIYFVFGLLGLSIYSFIHERISPDLTALSVLGLLVFVSMISGVNTLPSLEATLGVFAHPAPITIAGMFIVSTALEKTGVIKGITNNLGSFHNYHTNDLFSSWYWALLRRPLLSITHL